MALTLPHLLILLPLSFIGGSEVPIYPCQSGGAQGSHAVRPIWIDPTLSQVGLLQTPNFPRPFALPLECLWIFDLSKAQAKTNYLHFYFTQVRFKLKICPNFWSVGRKSLAFELKI